MLGGTVESKAYVKIGKVGFPKTVVLSADGTRLTATTKAGEQLFASPLSELTDIKYKAGYISVVANGQEYGLGFLNPWGMMFGLVGALFFGPGSVKRSKAWRSYFEDRGLKVS